MAEIEKEVKPKKVVYQCDECGEGWLQFTGLKKPGIENGKFKFVHHCLHCKKIFNLDKEYPLLIFSEIKKD